MNLKTIRTLAITSALIAGVAGLGTAAVHAATIPSTTARPNPMTTLITAISQKFHLNQADVQKVFDDQQTQMHQQMEAQHQAEFKTRLAEAVTSGKLTQTQADLITTKQAEVKTFMDSVKDKTETERQTAVKTKMDEVKQWAKDNNIPEQFAFFGPMGGPGRHGRGPGEQGQGGRGGMMRGGMGMHGRRGMAPTAPGATPPQAQNNQ
jgi:hypothetical protein